MAQTKVSQFFKRKETAKVKRKQTSIDIFCVKNTRPFFDAADDEVICLDPKKTEKRPVGRPRKYRKLENTQLDMNELHDFNELLAVDRWYSVEYKKFYENTNATSTRKRFSAFNSSCENYRETARAFGKKNS